MASESDDSGRSPGPSLRLVSAESHDRPKPREKPGAGARRYGEGELIGGKYRLGKLLGHGGMGEVWLAHNETLDIDVAIKLIRGGAGTEEMSTRLLNEARAAARLEHPAIVRVNDFGKTELGDPYIVMELLEGEDLATILVGSGRLSAIKAVRTLLPIAHALTIAHGKGIVHRDLKPGNIFLSRTEEGHVQPKLVDFGVAKLEKEHSQRVTQNGALLGSPLYMSPEQARGDDVDHRADIWALAVVLYEAVVGRPPFDGKNYNAVLYSITANPPTPITDLSVGDAELWRILDKALQKDPDRRWHSMRELGECLSRWLSDRGIHEDITGASLESHWLEGPRADDGRGGGSRRPALATGKRAPLDPRLRSTTASRRRRGGRLHPSILLAAGALVLAAIAAWALASRRTTPGPVTTAPAATPSARLAPLPLPEPDVPGPGSAAPEPSASLSSTPVGSRTNTLPPPVPHKKVVTKAPVEGDRPRPLKDPFQ